MPVTLVVDPDGVAHLTLDRAAKRNALDMVMVRSLHEAVDQIGQRQDVRVVVVRGAGGVFSAGADIADWVDPELPVAAEQSRLGAQAFGALAGLPMASVAVLEGSVLGGGLELAMACDLRIAADDALLGLPELGLGNLPSWGGTARLVDVAGLGVTRQLLLSSELISGTRAAELGVVTASYPAETLQQEVDAAVGRLLGAEPTAVALVKELLAGLESTLVSESVYAGYTAGLESSRSRKRAFLDRRATARRAKEVADRAAQSGSTTENSVVHTSVTEGAASL